MRADILLKQEPSSGLSMLNQKQSTTTRSCSTWKRLEKERKTKDLQSAARGLMSRSSRSPLAGSHFACCVDTDGLSNKAGSTYPEGLVGD